MPDALVAERPAHDQVAEYDAIVIGAGISGLFMLYRLREMGMTTRVFEAGTNVLPTTFATASAEMPFPSDLRRLRCPNPNASIGAARH